MLRAALYSHVFNPTRRAAATDSAVAGALGCWRGVSLMTVSAAQMPYGSLLAKIGGPLDLVPLEY
jgi:hypothetical protein